MQNISGFGLKAVISASATFPSGFTVTEFADDADPIDNASMQIADKAMNINGQLVTWGKANPIPATINVLPGSEADVNLAALFHANRPSAGRRMAMDEINITLTYPDGKTVRLIRGIITDGVPGAPVASAGRLKSKAYQFAFEDMAQ
jgi:hypothetical protein